VVAGSCSIADAAATSIGNLIDSPADIEGAIEAGRRIKELSGIVIIIGEKVGMWGDLEIVSLKKKT
jgi:ApbE superfamily uncharacterized protein (UPF0280 family)